MRRLNQGRIAVELTPGRSTRAIRRGLIVRTANRQTFFVLALVLLASIMALPATAQEATDYPPEVEGEVVESDNGVDSDQEADVGELVTSSEDAEGAALAQTGGEIIVLLLAGLLLAVLGGAALVAGRRRRSTAGLS